MDLLEEALRRFEGLLARAKRARLNRPEAMTLSTSDKTGRVTSRTVLLKGADREGFAFYTNLDSRKSRQLAANPRASLCFYWDPLLEQATVEGEANRVPEKEADAYWATRPRLSQIGAWASRQSEPMPSRMALLGRVAKYTALFAGRRVPRPDHWSGFRLVPERIEFWKGGAHRLNHRTVYERRGGEWRKGMLYP